MVICDCKHKNEYHTIEDFNELIKSGKLFKDIGLEKMNPKDDRAMICGSPEMLKDTQDLLDSMDFKVSPRIGEPGDYVIEHAFVEK